jgi:uridine kinase
VVELSALAAEVLDSPAGLGRVRMVVVDGPSGSGKTTLAGRLQAALTRDPRRPRTALVHLDDLYEGWSGLHADRGHGTVSQRVRDDLLGPLARTGTGRWRRYDWHAGAFAEWHTVEHPDVLLIEGCGSADPAYAGVTTLSLWVETDRAQRLRRGIARDGAQMTAHWEQWQGEEDALFAARGTRARADLRVDGNPLVSHDPDRQLVLLE